MCACVLLEQASACAYAVHTYEEITLMEWETGFVCFHS